MNLATDLVLRNFSSHSTSRPKPVI